VSAFAEATAVAPSGDGWYDAAVDPAWSIGGVPNGGYTLAIATRAALTASGREDPLAVSGHFTRPPAPGPVQVRVEALKAGRRASTLRASLWQDDVLRLDVLVTAGRLPADGPDDVVEWTDRPPPAMPAPEDCSDGDRGPFQVELLDMVTERIDPATLPFRAGPDGEVQLAPTGTPELRGWLRLADGAEPDPLFALLAVDAMPPTVFNLDHFGWAPTVELTVLLRGRPAPGWLACEARSHLLAGGWFDEESTAWDSTGRLVAQARQLALVGER
jgi:acyl-CoA thioesterase